MTTTPSGSHPGAREWRDGPYAISTDRSRLDVELIHRSLSREFFDAEGIPRDVIERAIARSLCFGLYEGDRQVGFARVVTDGATFAFLTDDFVVESHRGRGLASWLVSCVLEHPDLRDLRRILLVTHDPRLYRKVGFGSLAEPESWMELRRAGWAGPARAPP